LASGIPGRQNNAKGESRKGIYDWPTANAAASSIGNRAALRAFAPYALCVSSGSRNNAKGESRKAAREESLSLMRIVS